MVLALASPKELAQVRTEGVWHLAPLEMTCKSKPVHVHPARRASYEFWCSHYPDSCRLSQERRRRAPVRTLTISVALQLLEGRNLLRHERAAENCAFWGDPYDRRARLPILRHYFPACARSPTLGKFRALPDCLGSSIAGTSKEGFDGTVRFYISIRSSSTKRVCPLSQMTPSLQRCK
jgi:hypothetical protein